MQIGVTKFPGTNNELDVVKALKSLGEEAQLLTYSDSALVHKMDAIIIAGGFSYGDYLRPGIIAAKTPLMEAIKEYALNGHYVLGICNGFQILCESGLLPGALTTNLSTRFISKWVHVLVEPSGNSLFSGLEGEILRLPIAHYEGRYYNTNDEIQKLIKTKRIALRYCTKKGEISQLANPNGSLENIAAVLNQEGNVLGMMPHPERAAFDYLGSLDGRKLLQNFLEVCKC
ncbi:MAG: phosphoribosylformylglycinamidine synthase I [Candidatus Heimdallarchaeaceae archaeon]